MSVLILKIISEQYTDWIQKHSKCSISAYDLAGEAQFMIGESYSRLGDTEKATNAYSDRKI